MTNFDVVARWAGRDCPFCLAPPATWEHVHTQITDSGTLLVVWCCQVCDTLWEGTYAAHWAQSIPASPEESPHG